MLAAVTNLLGSLWGTAVARTISSGLIDSKQVQMTSGIMICALLAAVIWNLFTWWFGLPSSSSHALIGGLCGSAGFPPPGKLVGLLGGGARAPPLFQGQRP